jgi:putative ABC transport system permease protein
VDFRGPQYRDQKARHDYVAKLVSTAKALPGVRQAAVTTPAGNLMLVLKEGEPIPENRASRGAPVNSVSADFGPMLGMSLVKGRWLLESDMRGALMINESLARRDFADGDPVGTRIRLPWFGENGVGTIVGVVADLRFAAIDSDPKPQVFTHQADAPLFGVVLAMRIDGDPAAAAPGVRKALSAIDPTQSFYNVMTMEQALSDSISPRRFNLLLLGTFAFVALVLAVMGVYGVVAYAVSERTQEIGIRLALGAERTRVVRMIVTQGMLSVVTGIVVGLIAAAAATRLIAGLLYGVKAHDAPTFILATLALAVIAFVACTAPALKAAFVDPVIALRAE